MADRVVCLLDCFVSDLSVKSNVTVSLCLTLGPVSEIITCLTHVNVTDLSHLKHSLVRNKLIMFDKHQLASPFMSVACFIGA